MKAKDGIIDLLNRVLTENLTAINQYFVHGKMCENWGYARLHEQVSKRAFDEMKDADETIERILYLEGVPNMQRMGKVLVGETVPEQFSLDLKAEHAMLNLYAEGVGHCTKVGDYTTRAMLEGMQKDTDGHIDWIKTQLGLIKQVGLERYLSEQVHKGS